MNKVTTVNLNGNAFQLEESGYEALRAYLDQAAAQLAGNPDRDEIMSDIEQAMADKLRAVLGPYKTVATARQVETLIAEMGPVDAGEPGGGAATGSTSETGRTAAAGGAAANPGGGTPHAKKLYRLYDGALISGVCNGFAAYFNLDPTIVRVVFVILAVITSGVWILAYGVMVFAIPTADTPAERSAAHGTGEATAQDFIRRAKAGYYDAMKAMPDREARREWKRRFKHDMRAWAHGFQGEMQSGARRWQQHWQQCGMAYPGSAAGWALMLPVLTVVHAMLALACLIGVVSLLTTGTAWGVAVPAGIPLWVGLILFLLAYSLIVLPIKLARHMYRHQLAYGVHPGAGAFVHLWEALVWFAFVVVLVWLVHRHLPDVMEAIHRFPPLVRDAAHSIREWWSQ